MATARNWIESYYKQEEGKFKIKLKSLIKKFEENKYPRSMSNEDLFKEIPVVFLALYAERDDIALFFQKNIKGEAYDAVNDRGEQSGRTSLHLATIFRQRKIVAQLCRISEVFRDDLEANVEDECGKAAVQYAVEMKEKGIEGELMRRSDVSARMEGLHQTYVDAANAILVGAVLIAGVTFAGWLQPPLGYEHYYNLPEPSAPPGADAFQVYAGVQQKGVRAFWVFNCLSFGLAIASILACLVAVVLIPRVYIGTSSAHLYRWLPRAASYLGSSIWLVSCTFVVAGFAILPPEFKYKRILQVYTIIGLMPCSLLLYCFYRRLGLLRWPVVFTLLKAKILLRPINREGEALQTEGAGVSTLNVERNKESYKAEDYKFGENYAYYPWEDGLNVPSLLEIKEHGA